MKLIGITGGVGAGKSQILSYIQRRCRCRILLADEAAHRVEEPGQACYERLVELLGKGILQEGGAIDRRAMAERIFADEGLRRQVNACVHPAVKAYILGEIEKEREAGDKDFFFLEAALLIEEGYGQILDELWYIHADAAVRRNRLRQGRGYSEEKIDRIFESQLSEQAFRAGCKEVIDNSGSLSDTYRQIDKLLQRDGKTE